MNVLHATAVRVHQVAPARHETDDCIVPSLSFCLKPVHGDCSDLESAGGWNDRGPRPAGLRRLLLRKTVKCSEAPHEIDCVNSDHRSIGKKLRQNS